MIYGTPLFTKKFEFCHHNKSRCVLLFSKSDVGGFHLHLLVFSFVYQLDYGIGVLVRSSIANNKFRRISATLQHHFKDCLLWVLHEKEWSFYTHLFCCTKVKWISLSVQVPHELPVEIPVQLLLQLEANLLDQNVNELEFGLSRI